MRGVSLRGLGRRVLALDGPNVGSKVTAAGLAGSDCARMPARGWRNIRSRAAQKVQLLPLPPAPRQRPGATRLVTWRSRLGIHSCLIRMQPPKDKEVMPIRSKGMAK